MTGLDMAKDENPSAKYPQTLCEGMSYSEMLERDTRRVPDFLIDESQQDLGTDPISTERYTSDEYARLENEKMWSKVWQFAAREEELPDPGDSVVFENAGRSYVIIRQEDLSVRVFHNVCLHRGRKLRNASGFSPELKCPFHGFTWNNDGTLKSIPCAWDFAHLQNEEMSLPELRVDRWQGFIMVSEKQDIENFVDWIGPVAAHFERWRLDECYTKAWVGRRLPVNWKVAAEAFMEAFHSVTTHPQILGFTGDANTRYDLYGDYVNRAITPSAVLSPHVADQHDQAHILKQLGHSGGRRPDGKSYDLASASAGISDDDPVRARKIIAETNRQSFGQATNRDYSDISDTEMVDNFTYNIFPNFSPWGGFVPNLVYRWTAGSSADECMMEIRILARNPLGEKMPRSAKFHLVPDDEPFLEASDIIGKPLAAVFDQDLANLPSVQEGLKASATGMVQLGHYQESRIRHFCNTLDKYMNA